MPSEQRSCVSSASALQKSRISSRSPRPICHSHYRSNRYGRHHRYLYRLYNRPVYSQHKPLHRDFVGSRSRHNRCSHFGHCRRHHCKVHYRISSTAVLRNVRAGAIAAIEVAVIIVINLVMTSDPNVIAIDNTVAVHVILERLFSQILGTSLIGYCEGGVDGMSNPQ